MKCLNCGEYITSNQLFCSACGKANIFCPICGDVVSSNDSFCGKCGNKLSEIIEISKKKQIEKENRDREKRTKKLREKNQKERETEMVNYALDMIIDCEGNVFKAIKKFKEKYNVDNEKASEYICKVYDNISNNIEKKTSTEINNNYQGVSSIKEINEVYSYNTDPNEIKKTIIVSQSSRKKATSAISRGLIGGAILGPVGLLAGASAKLKETTTFQIIYNNGSQKTVTVKNGSWAFKEYCKYLDA